jgi:hypothetical protein
MSARTKRPTDEVETAIYDASGKTTVARDDEETAQRTAKPSGPAHPRAQSPTKQGYARGGGRTAMEMQAPSDTPESIRVISLKKAARAEKKSRKMPKVQIRSIGEISGSHTPPRGMGNLAPPRDPHEARTRHTRSNLLWGAVALVVAIVVATAVWLIARR